MISLSGNALKSSNCMPRYDPSYFAGTFECVSSAHRSSCTCCCSIVIADCCFCTSCWIASCCCGSAGTANCCCCCLETLPVLVLMLVAGLDVKPLLCRDCTQQRLGCRFLWLPCAAVGPAVGPKAPGQRRLLLLLLSGTLQHLLLQLSAAIGAAVALTERGTAAVIRAAERVLCLSNLHHGSKRQLLLAGSTVQRVGFPGLMLWLNCQPGVSKRPISRCGTPSACSSWLAGHMGASTTRSSSAVDQSHQDAFSYYSRIAHHDSKCLS